MNNPIDQVRWTSTFLNSDKKTHKGSTFNTILLQDVLTIVFKVECNFCFEKSLLFANITHKTIRFQIDNKIFTTRCQFHN